MHCIRCNHPHPDKPTAKNPNQACETPGCKCQSPAPPTK